MYETEKMVTAAEEFCEKKSEWVLKEDQSKWVDCFKKSSNIDKKTKDKNSD